jgi:hypothetical protein
MYSISEFKSDEWEGWANSETPETTPLPSPWVYKYDKCIFCELFLYM